MKGENSMMSVTRKIFSHPTHPTATYTPPYYAYALTEIPWLRLSRMTTVVGQICTAGVWNISCTFFGTILYVWDIQQFLLSQALGYNLYSIVENKIYTWNTRTIADELGDVKDISTFYSFNIYSVIVYPLSFCNTGNLFLWREVVYFILVVIFEAAPLPNTN